MSFDNYLAIPFRSQGRDQTGCDCWGLLWMVYRDQLGIDLISFAETPAQSIRDVARLIARHKAEWFTVEEPRRFDAVIMKVRGGETNGLDAHVGVSIDGKRLLHTEHLVGPRVDRFDDPFMKRRIVEVRRHGSFR